MATLAEIVRYNAGYVQRSGFDVKITSNMPWVEIIDINDPDGGFFLDGDEAGDYIEEIMRLADDLEEENGNIYKDLTMKELELSVAKQWID